MSRRIRNSHGGIHSPTQACYHAAADYLGGIHGLAATMQKSYDVLRKKLDESNSRYFLTLDEAMQILGLTGDKRILDAINAAAGAVWFFPNQVPALPCDMDVLKTGTNLIDSAVAIITELQQALEDNDITQDERARLDKRFMRLQQAMNQTQLTAKAFECSEVLEELTHERFEI